MRLIRAVGNLVLTGEGSISGAGGGGALRGGISATKVSGVWFEADDEDPTIGGAYGSE